MWSSLPETNSSGARLSFVSPALYRCLIEARIGLETMDSAAACRTYNVLLGEDRRRNQDGYLLPAHHSLERSANRHRLAFMPFGAGQRMCIGNQLALLESRLIVAMVAQRFRLDLVPGHAVIPEPLITLRPKFGVKVTAHHLS